MSIDGKTVSLAIETTCNQGGLALGIGDSIAGKLDFDAARRAAVQTVGFIDNLLGDNNLTPADVDVLYVSVGPGSFTGTRVGVTVARAFAQAQRSARCVAVDTPSAVVAALKVCEGDRAAVIQDARRGNFYISRFVARGGRWQRDGESRVTTIADFVAGLGESVTVTGEGLGYCELDSPLVEKADSQLWLPKVENVWHCGAARAKAADFVDYHQLLPIYTGKPFITQKAK